MHRVCVAQVSLNRPEFVRWCAALRRDVPQVAAAIADFARQEREAQVHAHEQKLGAVLFPTSLVAGNLRVRQLIDACHPEAREEARNERQISRRSAPDPAPGALPHPCTFR